MNQEMNLIIDRLKKMYGEESDSSVYPYIVGLASAVLTKSQYAQLEKTLDYIEQARKAN
jgi:ribosomal protein S19E (S16A)